MSKSRNSWRFVCERRQNAWARYVPKFGFWIHRKTTDYIDRWLTLRLKKSHRFASPTPSQPFFCGMPSFPWHRGSCRTCQIRIRRWWVCGLGRWTGRPSSSRQSCDVRKRDGKGNSNINTFFSSNLYTIGEWFYLHQTHPDSTYLNCGQKESYQPVDKQNRYQRTKRDRCHVCVCVFCEDLISSNVCVKFFPIQACHGIAMDVCFSSRIFYCLAWIV